MIERAIALRLARVLPRHLLVILVVNGVIVANEVELMGWLIPGWRLLLERAVRCRGERLSDGHGMHRCRECVRIRLHVAILRVACWEQTWLLLVCIRACPLRESLFVVRGVRSYLSIDLSDFVNLCDRCAGRRRPHLSVHDLRIHGPLALRAFDVNLAVSVLTSVAEDQRLLHLAELLQLRDKVCLLPDCLLVFIYLTLELSFFLEVALSEL